jgi:PIN domain nuclease of toxin-antitoxin system
MKLLLDTHALLWWLVDDPRLSARVRELVADDKHQIFVSAASAWEIATKFRLGKLAMAEQLLPGYGSLVEEEGFCHLEIGPHHALRAGSYVLPHGDPFDRMLAAQAEMENILLVSCDPAFSAFPVQVVW